MTTQNIEQATERADVLQELMAQTDARAAFSDPGVPEGTLLSEYELPDGGGSVRYRKPRSMVRNGQTPLPERFMAFDKFGNMSMLPTATMQYSLSKPRADSPGERAFHTHTRGMTRETCPICPPAKEPIAFRCEWCMGARKLKDTFFSETDAILHQRRMHTDEFEASERAIERAERRAQLEMQQKQIDAQISLAQAMQAQAESQTETRNRRTVMKDGA